MGAREMNGLADHAVERTARIRSPRPLTAIGRLPTDNLADEAGRSYVVGT